MKLDKRIRYGFTIVEILIVITVIGILATITAISYNGLSGRAVANSLQSDLVNASDFLRVDQAQSSTGVFPATLVAGNGGLGVVPSAGTTFTYVVNNTNTPKTFCLTATKSGQSYNINQEGIPFAGPCPLMYLDPAITTSYSGTGTVMTNLSGSGVSGNLTGGVGYNSANSGVLVFDGSDDYVSVTSSALGINHPFTMSVWMKTSTTFAYEPGIISLGYMPVIIMQTNGKVRAWWYNGTGYPAIASTKVCNDGVFHNLSLTYDGTTMKLYVDGALEPNGSLVSSSQNLWGVFYLGREFNGGNKLFVGQIGEAKIYDSVLSADDVKNNFNSLKSRYGL